MSSFAFSFLSTGPRVTREDNRLHAQTSLFVRILSLFSWNKEVLACPREGKVMVNRTALWVFHKRTEIPLTQIREINYKYANLLPFSSVTAADAVDCYTILLELQDRREIKLFSWIGAGEFENNSLWPDWCYWDEYLVDMQGTQTSESMMFYELIRGMWKEAADNSFSRPGSPPPQAYGAPPAQKPAVRPAPPPPQAR